eukprot:TRINITY_DN67305_c0_g1_i1.p3 TRINITY_DN67305_c0_g1~~TRINITY_DN67305_c0_g1_i1.p3  ORF type:complete len:100 (-),score=0.44 TRINITY_DN67305_c0_g1_i1:41-295(-)
MKNKIELFFELQVKSYIQYIYFLGVYLLGYQLGNNRCEYLLVVLSLLLYMFTIIYLLEYYQNNEKVTIIIIVTMYRGERELMLS